MGTPILSWQPGGGVPITVTPLEPPLGHAAGENGIAPLIEDQSYIDVVFSVAQPRSDWTFIECRVLNTVDFEPLNIWPGIVTDKSRTGFTLQLNGLPDSGNYYLSWSINGATVGTAGVATSYLFSGPVSGPIDAPSSFVVALPAGMTLDEPITITPDDAGEGGTFTPVIVELSASTPTAYFTYTPVSYGTKIIGVNDDAGMADPAMLNFVVVAATYTLTGPSSGGVGVPSTNFTVALPVGAPVTSTVTVTLSDAGAGGTFAPSSLTLTTAAPSATFTYTPASTGIKTIATTNNRGLSNPTSLSYNVVFDPSTIAGLKLWLKADAIIGVADAAQFGTWSDSSGNGNDATQTGTARPVYAGPANVSAINGKPVVAFSSASSQFLNLTTSIPFGSGVTVLAVMKPVDTSHLLVSIGSSSNPYVFGPSLFTTGNIFVARYDGALHEDGAYTNAAHVYTGTSSSGSGVFVALFVDGVSKTLTYIGVSGAPANANTVGRRDTSYSDGYIAELLVYDSVLGTTDQQAVELYLKTKYATP